MHNMTGLLGAAVGVAIAAVIWAVVVSLRKKRSGDAPKFDERQLAARAGLLCGGRSVFPG